MRITRTLLTDRFYLEAFVRTLALSAAATIAGLLLAAPAAYFLARLRAAWVRWLIVLLLISSFVSIVVKVLGLTMLLGNNGAVSVALRMLTGGWWSVSLLHNGTAVVIGLVQYTLPLLVMLLFGVIQNIPVSLEEAALVHGASDWRLVRRVLLPLAWPGLITAGLISFNMNMGAFTSAVLLGGGNVLTFPVLIQRKIILEVDYPTAAALSVLLTLAVVRRSNLVALAIPPNRAPAIGGCLMKETRSRILILAGAILAYVFLLLPLLVVIGASLDSGAQAYFRFPPQEMSLRWYVELPAKYWASLGLSFALAFTASAFAVAVGALAALGIARGSLRGSAALETYFRFPLQVPFVVSGIVFLQFYYLLSIISASSCSVASGPT